MSALAWGRRQWRERTRQAIAREQGRCRLCHKKDKTGLMDGLCTGCFLAVQERIAATPAFPILPREEPL